MGQEDLKGDVCGGGHGKRSNNADFPIPHNAPGLALPFNPSVRRATLSRPEPSPCLSKDTASRAGLLPVSGSSLAER
ncbi:hypothetical protein D187_005361 [Cystobacter fuscus DSM 2262]|uniref:Uncharacterized protein n=1 Tax=Cystobacter fuscus (strain ATCC 25194 / DSM 2262 / NBRC 100088 / M29) TaxID=1242864 RepID=S9PP29_CYSF2|nr:hypothetical protein D187_005361 [Cystobacter fuscus DSM 2262]